MSVSYASKQIIPAPFVSITKEFVKAQDGTKLGANFSILVNGTIVAWKGSPDSNGTFWQLGGYPADETIAQSGRLASILKKQAALRGLFAVDGQLFEIQPLDGSQPTKFYPRIKSLTFQEGIWTDRCDYTIEMETDLIYGSIYPTGEDNFSNYILDANETWSVEHNEGAENENATYTFRLTHDISAIGKRHYDDTGFTTEAWQQARTYVQSRIGYNPTYALASGSLNLPAYLQGYDHVRSETINKLGGGYSVTETWLLSSGNALEDFTVSTNNDLETNLTNVSINGEIRGLATRDSNYNLTQSKDSAAQQRFLIASGSMLSRAQTYAGLNLNATPLSKSVGRNPMAGVITYGFTYDNRPTNLVSTALAETITIVDNHPVDIFAQIPVLGRKAGPVLQAINASGERVRQLSVELVMPIATGSNLALWMNQKPNIATLVTDATPVGSQVFKNNDNESWNPRTGRYSRDISWTWEL